MRASASRGFSLVELVVALGLTLVVTAAIFDLVAQARLRFDAEPDAADRQQRIRAAVDALQRDLLMASVVLPYRAASPSPDPPGTYKDDVATIVSAPDEAGAAVVRTYYVRRDPALGASQLMRAEGGGGDAPVVDGVTTLAFGYFGEPVGASVDLAVRCNAAPAGGPLVLITGAEFTDGPWCPAAEGAEAFDADVLRVRKVGVRLGVRTMSGTLAFDVAPRNRNQGR